MKTIKPIKENGIMRIMKEVTETVADISTTKFKEGSFSVKDAEAYITLHAGNNTIESVVIDNTKKTVTINRTPSEEGKDRKNLFLFDCRQNELIKVIGLCMVNNLKVSVKSD